MKMKTIVTLWLLLVWNVPVALSAAGREAPPVEIQRVAREFMAADHVPGMYLVVMREGRIVWRSAAGWADRGERRAVDRETRFEIGAVAESLTAAALQELVRSGRLREEDDLSLLLPWFQAEYSGRPAHVTVRDVLYHTSGLPVGVELPAVTDVEPPSGRWRLAAEPGRCHSRSAGNILLAQWLIARTGGNYARFMNERVLSGLEGAGFIADTPPAASARGHRIGFSFTRPLPATPPADRTPFLLNLSGAGAERWLQALLTAPPRPRRLWHEPGEWRRYAPGWQVVEGEFPIFWQSAGRPGFSAFVAAVPGSGDGVALLANIDAPNIAAAGHRLLGLVTRQTSGDTTFRSHPLDKTFTVTAALLALTVLVFLFLLARTVWEIARGRRRFHWCWNTAAVGKAVLLWLPFLVGVWLIPRAVGGLSWSAALVEWPFSFPPLLALLAVAAVLNVLLHIAGVLFPGDRPHRDSFLTIVILSVLPGIANAVLIFLITGSLSGRGHTLFIAYYFALGLFLFVLGGKIGQTRLIRISNEIVLDLRMKMVKKIFSTSFQRFERIDRGRVYATINDDIGFIGTTFITIVGVATSLITIVAVFVYLAAVSWIATLSTLIVLTAIVCFYYLIIQKANGYFEAARDTRNTFMGLIDGLLNGFKELLLHRRKIQAYKGEIEETSREFCEKSTFARTQFLYGELIGQTMLIMVLGIISFAFPWIFPQVRTAMLMSFVMALLYLVGPIGVVFNSFANVAQLRIAWNRVQTFIRDIPATSDGDRLSAPPVERKSVSAIQLHDVEFRYEANGDHDPFTVGPLNLTFRRGEITFIIGGNGSGKTTLAKLLTGLYQPSGGRITVDGEPVAPGELGEYFSVVFSDFHLFRRMYNVSESVAEEEIFGALATLKLQDKVRIVDHTFSTVELSGGQKKRLALLQCYLEDNPVYLFDEWAADQDPQFRRFFYRELLVRMRQQGKIVIAITHDDHYFDVADHIVKLDRGSIDVFNAGDVSRVLSDG